MISDLSSLVENHSMLVARKKQVKDSLDTLQESIDMEATVIRNLMQEMNALRPEIKQHEITREQYRKYVFIVVLIDLYFFKR